MTIRAAMGHGDHVQITRPGYHLKKHDTSTSTLNVILIPMGYFVGCPSCGSSLKTAHTSNKLCSTGLELLRLWDNQTEEWQTLFAARKTIEIVIFVQIWIKKFISCFNTTWHWIIWANTLQVLSINIVTVTSIT